jgi:hypothetical protein
MRADRNNFIATAAASRAPAGLTADVRRGPLAGRPLDGGVRRYRGDKRRPFQSPPPHEPLSDEHPLSGDPPDELK